MTKDTIYILIATMMNMNAYANRNEIVNTYTAEDAQKFVWSTYGMKPNKQQIEETFIKLIWHTHNALCLHVGGVEGLSKELSEREQAQVGNTTP